MDSRRMQKSLPRGSRPAFREPYKSAREPHDKNRNDTEPSATDRAAMIQDGDAGIPGTLPVGLSDKLASELFARLLLELPDHRRDLETAYREGSNEQLERLVHKLLGAVVYCELPVLARVLRDLKQTIRSGDEELTGQAFGKTIRLIDDLLDCSGYSGS